MQGPRDPEEEEAAEPGLPQFRPIDRRRIREIRHWLEGTCPDAPTREELQEFLDWVAAEIEWHLARRQSVDDLLLLLNAAREEAMKAAEGQSRGSM